MYDRNATLEALTASRISKAINYAKFLISEGIDKAEAKRLAIEATIFPAAIAAIEAL